MGARLSSSKALAEKSLWCSNLQLAHTRRLSCCKPTAYQLHTNTSYLQTNCKPISGACEAVVEVVTLLPGRMKNLPSRMAQSCSWTFKDSRNHHPGRSSGSGLSSLAT